MCILGNHKCVSFGHFCCKATTSDISTVIICAFCIISFFSSGSLVNGSKLVIQSGTGMTSCCRRGRIVSILAMNWLLIGGLWSVRWDILRGHRLIDSNGTEWLKWLSLSFTERHKYKCFNRRQCCSEAMIWSFNSGWLDFRESDNFLSDTHFTPICLNDSYSE